MRVFALVISVCGLAALGCKKSGRGDADGGTTGVVAADLFMGSANLLINTSAR